MFLTRARKRTIFPKHFGVSALRRYITGTYQNILFVKRFMVSRTPTFVNKSRNGESIHIWAVTHFSAQIGPAIWWSKVLGQNFYSLVTRWFMLSSSLYDELLWKSWERLYFRQKRSPERLEAGPDRLKPTILNWLIYSAIWYRWNFLRLI